MTFWLVLGAVVAVIVVLAVVAGRRRRLGAEVIDAHHDAAHLRMNEARAFNHHHREGGGHPM